MDGVPQTIPTGKNNMLSSLRDYLNTYLPKTLPDGPYTVQFEQFENAESYPSISFEDMGMPSLGGHAFNRDFGNDGNGSYYRGQIAQTMVEFNCQAQIVDGGPDPVKQCYQMRDQLEYLLMYSGELDLANNQILPPIPVMNYDTNPATSTGSSVWAPMNQDSIWFESFIGTDPERPGVKRLSVRVRMYWHLLLPV